MTFLGLTPSGVGQVVTAYSRVVAGWSVMVDGLSLDVHGVSLGGICWGDFSLCRGRAGFDGGRAMPPVWLCSRGVGFIDALSST